MAGNASTVLIKHGCQVTYKRIIMTLFFPLDKGQATLGSYSVSSRPDTGNPLMQVNHESDPPVLHFSLIIHSSPSE